MGPLSPPAKAPVTPTSQGGHHSCWLGRLRSRSRRWHLLHGLLIAQLLLPPLPLPPGSFQVLASGPDDLSAPADDPEPSPEAGPARVLDSDGDHLSDGQESAAGTDPFNPDTDHDGLSDHDEVMVTASNPLSPDSDADGVCDYNAFYGCMTVSSLVHGPGASPGDWDGDGLKDPFDPDPFSPLNLPDSDGDHVPDPQDSDPLHPGLWNDLNGNGRNDDAELPGADLDGDGVANAADSHPLDPALLNDWNFNGLDDPREDWDGDGVINLQDSHPAARSLWCDWSGNGVNDDRESAPVSAAASATGFPATGPAAAAEAGDADGDGYAGGRDSHPADPALWNDHDGDGVNDEAGAPADRDRDGIADDRDAFPGDFDNDGLDDAGERSLGTDAADPDSDGDGLGDGEEVRLGTSPLNVDTDGDGLTDAEEVQAYHTDPLEPTGLAFDPQQEEAPAQAESALGLSHSVPDPAGEGGTRTVVHTPGASLGFPGKSATSSKADLTKTLVLTNNGASALTGLNASLSGPDAGQFRLGALSSADLPPGATRALSVSFLAPAPATQARSATLTFSAGGPAAALFTLQLRSVVGKGLWAANDDHFFADYTDSDEDGIPDLVEAMYLPLVVTAEGDLDGDGVSNLEQYLAGRDLRDRSRSTDVDADGLTNVMEDAWNAAYPGRLNKYYFADAVADPDGDGLLTLEELTCTWGGGGRDALAVATHPFVASSAPPTAAKTATYKVTARTPPKSAAIAMSGGILSRPSRHAAWMNDGLLRRALHETAAMNGGVLPAGFFAPERIVHAASGSLQTTQGSDHLPLGYLGWLGSQNPAVETPAPLPAAPSAGVAAQLAGLHLPEASDADLDGVPTAWEAAYELDWRDGGDSDLPHARAALLGRTGAVAARRSAIGTELSGLTGSTAAIKARRAALTLENDRLEAEAEALGQVLGRLTPGAAGWEGWNILEYVVPTVDGQPVERSSHLAPVYAIAEARFPAALAATPATTWNTRRGAWVTQQAAAHYWHVLAALDPDHDGLMNADEHLQGLSPRLPDYEGTGERDTDGDGFSDAMELATGTDPHSRGKAPVYGLEILTPAAQRVVSALRAAEQPLRVRTVLRGPGGVWPLAGQEVRAAAPDNLTLLAWAGEGGGAPGARQWRPKDRLGAGVSDGGGVAVLHVNATWRKGALNLVLKSAPGNGAPAGLKAVSLVCAMTVSPPAGDSDADGLPDTWEGRAENALNKGSPLDASLSPLHFGFHPETPADSLPPDIQSQLPALRDATGFLSDYSPGTAQATDRFTTAQRSILALVDPDHDGWGNLEEHQHGTHPRIADNPATAARDDDQDGLPNLWEHRHGLNFNDARDADLVLDPGLTEAQRAELMDIKEAGVVKSYPEAYAASWGWSQLQWDWMKRIDPDHDGWTNLEEFLSGTNPRVADTTYLRVRRGGVQTAGAGQALPEPVVVQAVREVVSEGGLRTGFTAMADEEVTFSGPADMRFIQDGDDPPPGSNPLRLRTDETGYVRVRAQAPAQEGRHTLFASLGNGRRTALSLEVRPQQPPGTGGPGGGGPGDGPGGPQPNPEHTLQWQYVWREVRLQGSETPSGVSYHSSVQEAAAPGVRPQRTGAEAGTPSKSSPSGHYGHSRSDYASIDPRLSETWRVLYEPPWKDVKGTDSGTVFSLGLNMSAPPLNAENVLVIPFEAFSPVLWQSPHDMHSLGLSRSHVGPWVDFEGYKKKLRGRVIGANATQYLARLAAVKEGQPVALPQGMTLTMLVVEEVTQLNAETGAGMTTDTRVRRTLQMAIPPGGSASPPIETETLMSPATPGTQKILTLLPIDITGHRRGTFNAPGAVSTGGTYGKETVLLENADRDEGSATQRDLDTATLDKAIDDDLVKVVLSFPANTKPAGVGLKLKHEGMKVDGTKTTFDSAVVREGASRLNFYDDQGNKLTDADLKIDDLANPGSGYMAKIVTAGTLTLFIEGADNFGMVGTSDQSETNAKYMGGALLTLEMTGAGAAADSGPRLLVFRGGFFRYHQPDLQPGEIGTLEFCDGKGRITDTNTDYGSVIKSWSGRSGKTTGGDYDEPGENGHIPPGWRYIYKRSDFSATQRNREEGTGNSMIVRQGNYCRWLQDDNAPGYAANYLYKQSIEGDRNIGKPSMPTTTSDSGQTVMFKFQTEVIPPNTSQRTEIQFHPDGKKDGTAGCIGIQTYDACKEVYRYLNDFKAMKLKVELGTP